MDNGASRDGGRRGLQVTLGILSAIPFLSGLAGMLVGPKTLPGDTSQLGATADSEYPVSYTHLTLPTKRIV